MEMKNAFRDVTKMTKNIDGSDDETSNHIPAVNP